MSAPGPLVVRWHALERAPVEAGSLQQATVEVENAGSATWRTRGPKDGLFVAYHWLDERGNPIVWDGRRTPLDRRRRARRDAAPAVRRCAPRSRRAATGSPSTSSRSTASGSPSSATRRSRRRSTSCRATRPPRARSCPTARSPHRTGTSSPRALHAEGYSAVGGAVEPRARAAAAQERGARAVRARRRPPPAVPASARLPLAPAAARAERRGGRTAGLRARGDEPSMFDGRLVVRLRSRSDRRRA